MIVFSIDERKEECERQMLAHANALEAVKATQLGNWVVELNSMTTLGINELNNSDNQNTQVFHIQK